MNRASKLRWLGALAVALASGAVLAVLLLRDREPRFQGRTASAWARDLNHPDPLVRSNAAAAIREVGAEAAPVWDRALAQKDSLFKKPFLAGARKFAPWVRRMLNRILKPLDPDADRLAAARALEVLGSNAPVEPALRGLRSTDSQVASLAAGTLGRIGRPAVPGLIAALDDPDSGVRSLSLFSLGIMGPQAAEAAPALAHQLGGAITNNRPQVLYVLGRLGPPGETSLLTALTDQDSSTRASAASAFGGPGSVSSNVPPALMLAARRDDSPAVRLAAIEALSRVKPGSADSVATFTAALRDDDPGVRLAALQSLARVWHRAAPALPDLIARLEDSNPRIRTHAALVLELLGPAAKAAIPALTSRLQDPDGSVRERAAAALKRIAAEAPVPPRETE